MIAIIPARGGTKGLPGKNVKELDGIPLIAHTIKAAIGASCVDRVIVTTDDRGIAGIAEQYGAEVPFLRPEALATDTASAVDVYIHAVNFLVERDGADLKKFMVLLPTVPFRNSRHIDEAFELFSQSDCETLISVRRADVPPSWYLKVGENGYLHSCGFGMESGVLRNRQDDGGYCIPNGAIYILDFDILVKERTYYTDKTVAYVMRESDSVDIDTYDDFCYAEYIRSKVNIENGSCHGGIPGCHKIF